MDVDDFDDDELDELLLGVEELYELLDFLSDEYVGVDWADSESSAFISVLLHPERQITNVTEAANVPIVKMGDFITLPFDLSRLIIFDGK